MQAINLTYTLYKNKSFFIIILILVSYSSLWGQVDNKRFLTTQDYHLWNKLLPVSISSNGNWTSYRLFYKYTGKDTLVVQQSYGHKKYVFPGVANGKFNAETDFACLKGDMLILLDLKSGKQQNTSGVTNFAFSANQKFLVVLLKQADQKFTLEVKDKSGLVVQRVLDVVQYSFDPSGNGIVYSTAKDTGYSVELMLLKNTISKKVVANNHKTLIKNFVWKENTIAFIEIVEAENKLYVYHILQDKLNSLDSKKVIGFPSQMKISDRMGKVNLSEDGLKVIFWLEENQLKSAGSNPNAVQIWNTRDKQLFGSKKFIGDYRMTDKMAIWNLDKNSVIQITDKDLPTGLVSADFNYAFTYSDKAYEPQAQQNGAYDVHLVNLRDGGKKRIIERYTFGPYFPSRSPDGRYLCYPKQGHWWIYDIKQDLHTNITSGLSNSFFNEFRNRPGEDEPYGIGGWTKDGEVILYDRYDLWKITLDGKIKTRLTNGRDVQKTFRIKIFNSNPLNLNTEASRYTLDLKTGFLVTVANNETGETGISYWTSVSDLKELVWENKKIQVFGKAEHKNIYMYLDQSFSSQPRLMLHDGKTREIFRSNKQQDQFYWGKNERIDYIVNGIKTKGVLFYPAGYEVGKKYPMVVSIYERLFARMNDYENPSLLQGYGNSIEGTGNNVTNFTLQGYFVLYPDINYEYGNLRESVTQSVLTAVDTVVAKGNVYPEKIGLIGHSFGGYETNLIITQTDRFAAAVAGAAWSDLVSAYLYFGQETLRPDFFRGENHQFRIGKSLYEDMQSYLKNSPVLLADKVKTPLLGWVGKEDETINSLQSMEFFLALRRAEKEHTLLVYPKEGHTLENKESSIDLSTRVMQWFDYYLKNGKKQDWMNSDKIR